MSQVTIGIPVYNGERYIAETLDSVLSQTFLDFEILVADNASTDGTIEILERYAAKDSRIKLLLSDINVGAAGNYNRVLNEATSEFFAWLSADDLIEDTYLERSLEILKQRPDVVGVYANAKRIDAEGHEIGDYVDAMANLDLDATEPAIRFRSAVLGFPAIVLFGVMRRDVMLATAGHGAYIGGDRVFVSEIALRGRLVRLEDPLFVRRVHDEAYSALTSKSAKARWFSGDDTSPMSADIHRIRRHIAALRRCDCDRRTLATGLFTLMVQFPMVLAKAHAVSLTQRILQRFGRSLDYGRWAS